MKHIRLAMQPDRRTAVRLLLSVLIPCTLCLTSCTDSDEGLARSSRFSFTATVSDTTGLSTRSDRGNGLPQDTVAVVEGYSEPLYLHTLHEGGIAWEGSDSLSDGSAEGKRTRAAVATSMYSSFAVSAYSYKEWSESLKPNWFHGVTATESTGGYSLPSVYYWPGSAYKMKFFAYAPTGNDAYVLSASTKTGSPTITVNVPTDVSKQQDLLAAKSDELDGDYRSDVSLSFKHILTAVKFVCGDNMKAGTVNSVTLKNVYGQGTYNMGTDSWTTSGSATSFTQTLSKATNGTSGEAITTDAQTFMMIPQTLPADAQIEVKFTDSSNTQHTLTASISGTEWTKGTTVTFKLSTSSLSINWEYVLYVNAPGPFTYKGGSNPFYVRSYRTKKDDGTQPDKASWTAEFSTDGGTTWSPTKPDWLTGFVTSENDCYDEVTVTVAAQTGVKIGAEHTENLQKATVKGSSSTPYNLSNSTGASGVQNTANCYVVSAPGYYSFPLVYGNAIKDSQTNSSAYTSTKTETTTLQKFVNHLGNAITNPYISENSNCTPNSAELVWQDAKDLVKNIKYNSGTNGGNVSFYVDKSTIRQGNAVIAVKDASSNVLWSWHIWVTDEDLTKTIAVTNHDSELNYFMPVNLGWCDFEGTIYEERSCMVRITAGSESKEITITQSAGTDATWANSPFYQWGRKDPFLPALCYMDQKELTANNKTWYDKSGTSSTSLTKSNLGTGTDAIKNYILNPGTYTLNNGGDNTYYNLWSADNTTYLLASHDTKVVKTVYDPCPVGFTVPPGRAFTGFTKDGWTISASGDAIYGTWSSSANHYGTDFGTSGTSTSSSTIFLGYLGYRNYDGTWYSNDGRYWTAVPTVTYDPSAIQQGGYLRFSAYSIVTATGCQRGYGLSIRPTKEQ